MVQRTLQRGLKVPEAVVGTHRWLSVPCRMGSPVRGAVSGLPSGGSGAPSHPTRPPPVGPLSAKEPGPSGPDVSWRHVRCKNSSSGLKDSKIYVRGGGPLAPFAGVVAKPCVAEDLTAAVRCCHLKAAAPALWPGSCGRRVVEWRLHMALGVFEEQPRPVL